MARRTIAPYGTWKSPITPELLTSKAVTFGELAVPSLSKSPSASHLIFIENRPQEQGRAAVIRWSLDKSTSTTAQVGQDLTLAKFNARSGVHEYGGGAVAASSVDGSVIFTDYKPNDWGVYRVKDATTSTPSEPERITPDSPPLRYGGFVPHPTKPHLILAIQEDHTIDEPSKVVNTLVLIDASAKSVTELQSGRDFYSFAAWSPRGDFVAWVTWQHPSMPWWDAETWVARFDETTSDHKASLVDAKPIAGTKGGESVQHPIWLPRPAGHTGPDTLLFTSDRTSFSNPYKITVEKSGAGLSLGEIKPILPSPLKADFIRPQWTMGNSHFLPLDSDVIVSVLIRGSTESLALVSVSSGRVTELSSSYIAFGQLRKVSSTSIAAVVAKSDAPSTVVVIDLEQAIKGSSTSIDDHNVRPIKASSDLISSGQIPASFLSIPEDFEFPTTLPDGTPATSYGILYPPTNPNFSAAKGSAPPCIFKIHGGPTSAASKAMSLEVNYWTSRGYSICFVNYGGSTGYGREYMLRLNDNWGLVDVLDCCAAAKYLTSRRAPSTDEGKQVREMTATAQAQWKALEERYDSSGSVRVTLKNHKKQWSLFDALALPATTGLAALIPYLQAVPTNTSILTAPLIAGAAYIAFKSSSVLSEAVFASPTLGLQLETTRGLQLPFLSKPLFQRISATHVPRDRVLDVMVNTTVKGWSIRDYLAVGIRSHPMGAGSAKAGSKAVTRNLKVLFPHLEPRLPIVERIYKAIYPVIFSSSSNPVANAANVPPLRSQVDEKAEARLGTPRIKDAIISGGSAGGFTVLACLTKQPYVFSAGCSLYGVSELQALAEESHKFESNYLFRLLGGTPKEVPQIYHDRSPLYSASEVRSPVLVLQGSIDKVVPPNQAHLMVEGIKAAKGGADRVKYIEFEGEGHGFRQAANIITALNEEQDWYLTKLHLDQSQ
ncbi:alpha/beta-hydrolase [Microstroma glucosiphilum]|uniref:Alpha/beta-hydrolase n=1 Tax=Pseudomicrostroma glucosiphilum TaxID=1684307 RepID=A0A316U8G4_9BASI|nr:alpha/beta-hydrolase [Pseudomicrostroma glucosiphilum]PWN21138.1 alpha/beta-hydrolase [Pseudomicrostroma glucosiphilum]